MSAREAQIICSQIRDNLSGNENLLIQKSMGKQNIFKQLCGCSIRDSSVYKFIFTSIRCYYVSLVFS